MIPSLLAREPLPERKEAFNTWPQPSSPSGWSVSSVLLAVCFGYRPSRSGGLPLLCQLLSFSLPLPSFSLSALGIALSLVPLHLPLCLGLPHLAAHGGACSLPGPLVLRPSLVYLEVQG